MFGKKMFMKYISQLLLLLLLHNSAFASDGATEKKIAEYVFTHLIKVSQKALSTKNPQFYAIVLSGKDPDESLMKKFSNFNPPVIRFSEIETRLKSHENKESRIIAFITCRIRSITMTDSETATVVVDYGDNISGVGATYDLKSNNNKWQIIRDYHHIEYD